MNVLENIFLLFGYEHNCNGYVVNYSDESILIDSGLGSYGSKWGYSSRNPHKELTTAIQKFNITTIILTHAHLDHIGGFISLSDKERENITIICHEEEKNFIEKPDFNYIDPIMNIPIKKCKIDQTVKNDDILKFGAFNFKVIHTPGHTKGSISLYDQKRKVLFSGDCVFPQGSFGRIDFPGSNKQKMIESLEILANLDINSLFAGHMDPILSDASRSIKYSYNNARYVLL